MPRTQRLIQFEWVDLDEGFAVQMVVPYSWENFFGLMSIPNVRSFRKVTGYFAADGSVVML